MLSVTIVSLKILNGSFWNCLSCDKVLIMARGKELSNSSKALIVKLWKDGEGYGNILSNLNVPFNTIGLYIARFKRRNIVEKTKQNKKTGAPRKISLRLSRKLGHLINQNPIVTSEELQEDLRSSGCSETK